MARIVKLFNLIFNEIQYRYFLSFSIVRIKKGGKIITGTNTQIKKSKILVTDNSTLLMKPNSQIIGVKAVIQGSLEIGQNSVLENKSAHDHLEILINGTLSIKDFTRIRSRIWIRFGAFVEIGSYTNINEGTELRSDLQIIIGDYNQISYDCVLWDTNTHNIYPSYERRQLTERYFPSFGFEFERPKTGNIRIGNDCWIAKNVSILKNVTIKDRCVVAFGSTLSNCTFEENSTIIPEINLRTIKNCI